MAAEDLNLNDYISRQNSRDSLPDWGMNAIQKLAIGTPSRRNRRGRVIPGRPGVLETSWDRYGDAMAGIENAPGFIENARNLLNQQFTRDIQAPVTDAVRSAIRSGAGGGILNSSAFGDALGGVTSQALRSAEGQQTQSNVWAQQSLLDNLWKRLQASRGMTQDAGNLLGLTRNQTSSSTDPGAAAALLAKLMDLP